MQATRSNDIGRGFVVRGPAVPESGCTVMPRPARNQESRRTPAGQPSTRAQESAPVGGSPGRVAGSRSRGGPLTEDEFKATAVPEKERVGLDEEPPFDFWEYFELNPPEEFSEHDFSKDRCPTPGTYAGRSTGTFWRNARQLTFTVTTQGIRPC